MKINKLMKKGRIIFTFALLLCMCGFFSLKVAAATNYPEKEPNNSDSEAQLVFANGQTPAHFVSGTTTAFNSVSGVLTANDKDWYKVSFITGTDDDYVYFDINAGNSPIFIEVFNKDLISLGSFQYQKGSKQTFKIENTKQSMYYIKLYHTSTISQSYNFTFGKPKYKRDSYTHKFPTTTLVAKGTWEKPVNLLSNTSIPKDAIGYEVFIGGCTTSVSSKRYFSNNFYSSWVATKIDYTYKLPVTDSSKVAQIWKAKIISTSTKSNTITPTITIHYVAPDVR